jgi:hypothetical protein
VQRPVAPGIRQQDRRAALVVELGEPRLNQKIGGELESREARLLVRDAVDGLVENRERRAFIGGLEQIRSNQVGWRICRAEARGRLANAFAIAILVTKRPSSSFQN